MTPITPKVFIDGPLWLLLVGRNLHDGKAAFGRTLEKAVIGLEMSLRRPVTLPDEYQPWLEKTPADYRLQSAGE